MNRGSHCAFGSSSMLTISFNEAPIHESGKLDCPTSRYLGVLGFNEAPIHESGKSVLGGLIGREAIQLQ